MIRKYVTHAQADAMRKRAMGIPLTSCILPVWDAMRYGGTTYFIVDDNDPCLQSTDEIPDTDSHTMN